MLKRNARGLSQLQEQALKMFRDGKTNDAIASQLGVSARTIQRWRNTPESAPESMGHALAVLDEVKLQSDKSACLKPEQERSPVLKPKIDPSPNAFINEDSRKISELFESTLDGLRALVTDDNLSPRDRIACFRLVLELKRDVQAFCTKEQVRDSELSDFELVKERLRKIALSSNASPQGAIALLRLLQIQGELPESIVPNLERQEKRRVVSQVQEMPLVEKVRVYKELITEM